MPPRSKPDDFRRVFIAVGWDGIGRHYHTNGRVIARWIDEEGRADLVAARAAHVRMLAEEDRARRARHREAVLGLPNRMSHCESVGA